MSYDERYEILVDLGEMTAPPLSDEGTEVVACANEILRKDAVPAWRKIGGAAMQAVVRYGAYMAAMTPAGCAQTLAQDYERRRQNR